jgi:UDP-N-acetylmuramoyl-L-alanyl-D-glutamate--2,6-diaminopimelate ligase
MNWSRRFKGRVRPIKLQEIIKGLDTIDIIGDLAADVKGITYDSRKVNAGDLFIALKGQRFDGALCTKEALSKGAVALMSWREIPNLPKGFPCILVHDARISLAILSRNFFRKPDEKIQVIGVTGTNGKTSVCYFLEAALSAAGVTSGVLGTITYRIGKKAVPAERTTPESPDIHAFLEKLNSSGLKHCLMEVSSHAIALKRVHQIRFHQMIFTNLTRDHLDFHQTMEEYFQTKSQVFAELAPGAHAVINIDSPWGKMLLQRSKGTIVTYGRSEEADFHIEEIQPSLAGTRFALRARGDHFMLSLSLVGLPNVYNATASFAASLLSGYDPEAIINGIEQCTYIPGRFEKIDEGQNFTLIIDYAHTDDALENLLRSLQEIKTGRLITVFGCGGDRDRTKRPKMGAAAVKHSDFVIVTSDNPRGEEPEAIITEIESGIKEVPESSSKYWTLADRKQAIQEAVNMAEAGDTIVIAGKGHEPHQQIKDTFIPFDDREVAARMIRKKIGTRTQNATA